MWHEALYFNFQMTSSKILDQRFSFSFMIVHNCLSVRHNKNKCDNGISLQVKCIRGNIIAIVLKEKYKIRMRTRFSINFTCCVYYMKTYGSGVWNGVLMCRTYCVL